MSKKTLDELVEENKKLQKRVDELEIENEGMRDYMEENCTHYR